jgi:hypothetical protein
MPAHVMCRAGSKAFKLGVVNSPVRVAAKKVVVRHAKTAACNGNARSRRSLMAAMVDRVYGSLVGHFKVGGARFHAALYKSSVSISLMLHFKP